MRNSLETWRCQVQSLSICFRILCFEAKTTETERSECQICAHNLTFVASYFGSVLLDIIWDFRQTVKKFQGDWNWKWPLVFIFDRHLSKACRTGTEYCNLTQKNRDEAKQCKHRKMSHQNRSISVRPRSSVHGYCIWFSVLDLAPDNRVFKVNTVHLTNKTSHCG